MLRTADLRLRDPFILPWRNEACYYLYGTTDPDCWGPRGIGFDVYRSVDLCHWEGPTAAFRPPPDFRATHHFWAPEVHVYQGRCYMFASFKAEDRRRGTQVLVAGHPAGPFLPHSDGPVTPPDWDCLDGTLCEEPGGQPWMVFCHEWTQVRDGAMAAVRLSPDLRSANGEAIVLFRGSEAPWAVGSPEDPERRVTDGPWLHRMKSGELLMLWSSVARQGYAVGCAVSRSGSITGPWQQQVEPLFAEDGGHAMLFRRFDGELMLALHQPNHAPRERLRLLAAKERAAGLDLCPVDPASLHATASPGEPER